MKITSVNDSILLGIEKNILLTKLFSCIDNILWEYIKLFSFIDSVYLKKI